MTSPTMTGPNNIIINTLHKKENPMSDEQLKADIKSVTLCVFRAFDEEAEAALRRLRTRLERVPEGFALDKRAKGAGNE